MSNAIYSNARAKALENRLLGSERLYRMAECGSPEDALRILTETNFGDGLIVESVLDFEKLIDAERQKLVEFIKETCASSAFKYFFLLKNDFHNAEAFIKSKYLRLDVSDMTVEDGLIDKDFMKDKIMVDDYDDFPAELSKALKIIDGEFVLGTATGVLVNGLIKKALYDELFKVAEKDKHILSIYRIKADAVNISLSLRSRNYDFARRFFVKGGTLTESELKILCEETPDVLKEKAKYFKCSELALYAIDDFANAKPLSNFERYTDGYAVWYLKQYKYNMEGIFPYMLYCYYKSAEIDNVRIVMVGLINGMSETEIKGRLRESYEG